MTEFTQTINGIRATVTYRDEDVQTIFLPLLRHLSAMQRERGCRIVAFLAAPPGAGKSTLAAFLEMLSDREPGLVRLRAVGMDGFHMQQDVLVSHTLQRDGRTVRMVDIKGAPETFELDLFRARLDRLRQGGPCPWPIYDRQKHNPVDGAIRVTEDLVVVEGNYMLLDRPGWRDLIGFSDYTVRIRADEALLRERLVQRKLDTGRTRSEAEAFVDSSDLYNARTCAAFELPADLTLTWTGAGFEKA